MDVKKYYGKMDILDTILSLSSDEVFTPPKIANQVLDILPSEIWCDKSIKILDPTCKSGVFLRECAKRLFKGLEREIPDEKKRRYHIFKNMLYGIALTKLTYLITRKTLYYSKTISKGILGEIGEQFDGNIFYENIDHNYGKDGKCENCKIQKGKSRFQNNEKHAYAFTHKDIEKEIFKGMKFDVIIGNPPYQLNDGGGRENSGSSIALYPKFVDIAKRLNPRFVSFIIPSRWFTAGKGLDSFREHMMTDKKIRKICYFKNSKECFPTQKIAGGICYFLWDKEYNGATQYVDMSNSNEGIIRDLNNEWSKYNYLIPDVKALPIIMKVKKKTNVFFDSKVLSRNPFQFGSDFHKKFDAKSLTSEKTIYNTIKIYYWDNKKKQGYIERKKVKKRIDLIDKYKVFQSKTKHGDSPKLREPFLGLPGEICSETYLIIDFFDNKNEADNLISYMKTNFFKYLVLSMSITQNMSKKVFRFVPVLDYKTKWTDDLLFKKYDLNDLEIQTIVKSMDRGK